MRNNLKSFITEKTGPWLIFITSVLLIIKNTMISTIFPGNVSSVVTLIEAGLLLILCLALAGTALYRKLPAVSVMLILFFLWYCIRRIPGGVLMREIQRKEIFYLKLVVFFNIGILLISSKRKQLIDASTWVLCIVFFVIGILGIALACSGADQLQVWNSKIVLQSERQSTGILRFVEFFGFHRNRSSALFMVALWLAFYGFFSNRCVPVKVLFAVMASTFYVSVAIQHCRSTYVATAAGMGALVAISLLTRWKYNRRWIKWIGIPLFAVAIVFCTYKGFSVCNTAINAIAAKAEQMNVSETEANSKKTEMEPVVTHKESDISLKKTEDSVPDASKTTLRDKRNFFNDLRTFTMRTQIWNWALQTIRQDPEILIWGLPEKEIVPTVKSVAGATRDFYHLHNAFLQMLMLTGIPGMLLFLVFLVLWVIRAVRLFFSDTTIGVKVLIILNGTLLISAMIEPLFSSYANYSSVLFMFIAGITYTWEEKDQGPVLKA